MESVKLRKVYNSDGEDSLSLPHYEPYDSGKAKRKKVKEMTEVGSNKQPRSVSVLVQDWEDQKSPSKESHCIVQHFQKNPMKKVAKITSCERPKDDFWCTQISSYKGPSQVKISENIATKWEKDVLSQQEDDWSSSTEDHNDLITLRWNPTDNVGENDERVPTVITCRKCVLLARQWHKEMEMPKGEEQMEDLTTSTDENNEKMMHPWNSPLRSTFNEQVPKVVTCSKEVIPVDRKVGSKSGK